MSQKAYIRQKKVLGEIFLILHILIRLVFLGHQSKMSNTGLFQPIPIPIQNSNLNKHYQYNPNTNTIPMNFVDF